MVRSLDKNYFEFVNCPVCENDNLGLYFKINYGRLKQKKSLDYSCLGIGQDTEITLSNCKKCGFVFTNPRPKNECGKIIYNQSKKNLYKKDENKFKIGSDENVLFNRRRKLDYLNMLLKLLSIADLNSPLRLFDYGCGFGHTMSLARELGIEARGVDIDDFRLNYCKELGLDVYSVEEFKRINSGLKYNFIVCQSIVEHIIDLKDFILLVDSIAEDKSILYISGVTPKLIAIENKNGMFVKAHFLEHLNYFPDSTLDFLTKRINFYPLGYKIFLLNGKKIVVPASLARLFKSRNGFFERIYIKRGF